VIATMTAANQRITEALVIGYRDLYQ